jgi:hypothetical protein
MKEKGNGQKQKGKRKRQKLTEKSKVDEFRPGDDVVALRTAALRFET